ncbi:MAG TPA: YceI family protein [Ktedonobacterales bacterium]
MRAARKPERVARLRRRNMMAGAGIAAALVAVIAAVAYAVWVYGGPAARSGSSAGAAATLAPTLTPATGQTAFSLDTSATTATFTTHETLFGSPKTVVGSTSQVSGQILIDTADPAKSQVGEIRVDVSALRTDNDMRNNTIQGRILETGVAGYQYATFSATAYKGLPSSITTGQTVSFQIEGNLTVHGVTKPVTFDVTLTLVSAKQVTGKATTTVRYEDFNMAIPNVPNVSDVSSNVTLALDFTASAA